jgi:hypothetical protein
VTRAATDDDRIRCDMRLFERDILAIQEVNGEDALRRVADPEVYDVHVDDQAKGSLNGRQHTGVAMTRELTLLILPIPDVSGHAGVCPDDTP